MLNTLKALERQGWHGHRPARRRDGRRRARRAARPRSTRDTALVSVMHANNEVGTIQPIAELAAHRARARRAVSHRRRAVGGQDSRLGHARSASTCSRSPATSSAARRASARSGFVAACAWSRTMTGGRQERNRRAGTENVPAIAGLGVAARLARATARRAAPTSIGALRDRLERGILAGVPGTRRQRRPGAPRAEHDEHQLRRHRGRVAADRARPRRRRRVDRIGLFVGIARAVARAAGDGPAQRARPQLAALQPRPVDDRRRDRLRRSASLPAPRRPSCARLGRTAERGCADMRVVVAMSGGVDSSVAASLLAEAGHDVVGLSMQLYDQRDRRESVRVVLQPRRSARRAARRRRARHSRTTSSTSKSSFRRRSCDNFVDEYAAGPDADPVRPLQRGLKFATLVERAAGLRRRRRRDRPLRARARSTRTTRRYRLLRGVDRDKDQSYFLFSLTQDQLAHAMFPGRPPDEARGAGARARALGLAVADKPDSHEICFVPDGDAGGFVERQLGDARPSTARSSTAAGACSAGIAASIGCTVGQRKGLGLVDRRADVRARLEPADSRASWSARARSSAGASSTASRRELDRRRRRPTAPLARHRAHPPSAPRRARDRHARRRRPRARRRSTSRRWPSRPARPWCSMTATRWSAAAGSTDEPQRRRRRRSTSQLSVLARTLLSASSVSLMLQESLGVDRRHAA